LTSIRIDISFNSHHHHHHHRCAIKVFIIDSGKSLLMIEMAKKSEVKRRHEKGGNAPKQSDQKPANCYPSTLSNDSADFLHLQSTLERFVA
jgi:hypothetical protein